LGGLLATIVEKGSMPVCRSIVQLRRSERDGPDQETAAAARQFMRKVSGYRAPSKANTAPFEVAVAEVADATRGLLAALEALPRELAEQEPR
jgi:hypothetical protein